MMPMKVHRRAAPCCIVMMPRCGAVVHHLITLLFMRHGGIKPKWFTGSTVVTCGNAPQCCTVLRGRLCDDIVNSAQFCYFTIVKYKVMPRSAIILYSNVSLFRSESNHRHCCHIPSHDPAVVCNIQVNYHDLGCMKHEGRNEFALLKLYKPVFVS